MTLDTEPTWVPRLAVIAAHVDQLQEHGGEHGLREQGGPLDAALARPRNKFTYEPNSDLAELAAAYAFAIAKACHPFVDGNKRTAFAVAVIFLILNGYAISHSEDAVEAMMAGIADGSISEQELAAWFRAGLVAPPL